jgi:hypothetical protein
MATAKAKLHTVMARTGKKCRYETWQLPQTEAGSIALEGHPETGLVEFNKQDPMFACKLHLPDGVTIQSSSFRRKKDAEQDAALHALQKVRGDTSPFLQFYSHDRDICGLCFFIFTCLCVQFSVLIRTPLNRDTERASGCSSMKDWEYTQSCLSFLALFC